ncbi:MAG TPA: hypothetical protein VF463_03540 [Sphingobium sp.]
MSRNNLEDELAKYILVVPSAPHDGQDADYNSWYDDHHLGELCSIPGVISGKRFDAAPESPHTPDLPYLALYEIETDDPSSVFAEIGRRSASGEMTPSTAVNAETARLWLYKAH